MRNSFASICIYINYIYPNPFDFSNSFSYSSYAAFGYARLIFTFFVLKQRK